MNPNQPTNKRRIWSNIVLPMCLLVVGGWAANWLLNSAPQAKKERPPKRPKWVETLTLEAGQHRATISALGTVVAARKIDLMPQVSGRVESINSQFHPGGRLQAGDLVLQLERTDWELKVREAEAERSRMEAELRIEEGRQNVARREYELLGETIAEEDRDLVLRLPQLHDIQAKLETAEAKLAKAQLDLARCSIQAPFNASVITQNVNVGSLVQANTVLASLLGTDRIWVEVLVPISQLAWIEIPGAKNGVRIHPTSGEQGEPVMGTVLQLLSELEQEGRMARVLVEVEDPMAIASRKTPLLVGSLVEATIEGRELPETSAIPRKHIHRDREIWLFREGSLHIQPIEILFRNDETIYTNYVIEPGDQLITTQIEAPVEGMALRLEP